VTLPGERAAIDDGAMTSNAGMTKALALGPARADDLIGQCATPAPAADVRALTAAPGQ
jgi:hypothetical protein